VLSIARVESLDVRVGVVWKLELGWSRDVMLRCERCGWCGRDERRRCCVETWEREIGVDGRTLSLFLRWKFLGWVGVFGSMRQRSRLNCSGVNMEIAEKSNKGRKERDKPRKWISTIIG
jgi:hypothetical protein